MKTRLILLFLLQLSLVKADFDIDSLRRSAFKPIMGNYLRQVDQLCEKIKSTDDKKLIRHYAKELMELSDDMESTVNQFYGYKQGGMTFRPAFILTNTFTYAYVFSFYNATGSTPLATTRVNKIYDQATYIRFLYSSNPEKIKAKINKIENLVQDLRLFS
ncbi:MAG: hypothetical protein JNL60_06855 [Bacteroidia bacterium]|nr:hypothetical protein [Bacteroidia bacterium]